MIEPDPADRTVFALDDAEWVEFNARLDRPPESKPPLARLLTGRAVWVEVGDRDS